MSIIYLSGCISIPSTIPNDIVIADFQVNEWGVFFQEYDSNLTQCINSPNSSFFTMVRKPVIYFHADEDIHDITVEVNISKNVTTIPNATSDADKIQWSFSIQNNMIVLENGTSYDYLFYEGEIQGSQNILANVTVVNDNVTFHIKNIGEYPISNIVYIYGFPDLLHAFQMSSISISIDLLDSLEEKIITMLITNESSYNISVLKNSLIVLGLTEDESNDLIEYWSQAWFYPTNMGSFAQVIYMIPQEVYGGLLPIRILPKPNIINRVGLFFITDIPININEQ